MKKFFLIFFACTLGALITNAQDIKIIYQGSTIVNGGYVLVNGNVSSIDISQNLWIQNNTTDTLNMRVTKIELGVVPNTLNATCWEVCPPSDTAGQFPTITSPIIRMDPAAIEYSFAAHQYPEGISGCSHFRFIFFGDGSNYRDSVDIYFNHGQNCNTPASINGQQQIAFDVFPNPAKDLITVNLDENILEGEIIITNLLGLTVARYNVAELNGNKEISVANLQNGIYQLSILKDKEIIGTRSVQVLR
jgi:hypothetical protein